VPRLFQGRRVDALIDAQRETRPSLSIQPSLMFETLGNPDSYDRLAGGAEAAHQPSQRYSRYPVNIRKAHTR
jgi:hypothetical protein